MVAWVAYEHLIEAIEALCTAIQRDNHHPAIAYRLPYQGTAENGEPAGFPPGTRRRRKARMRDTTRSPRSRPHRGHGRRTALAAFDYTHSFAGLRSTVSCG